MNGRQVALQARQDVKEHLAIRSPHHLKISKKQQLQMIHVDGTSEEEAAKNSKQLHEDHVVGEAVAVARRGGGALLPPLLETVVEDGEAERQDEHGVDGDVRDDYTGVWSGG